MASPSRLLRPTVERLEARAVPATLTVNSLGDDGVGSGLVGDLRYCLNLANELRGPNTIRFLVDGTIALQSALPVITDDTVIEGNGAALTRISRSPTAQAEFTLLAVREASLALSGVSLSGGVFSYYSLVGTALDVSAGATLDVSACVIEDNSSYYGGVIRVDHSTATLSASTIRGNTTFAETQQRGVVYNYGGSLTLIGCTLSANTGGVSGAVFTESHPQAPAYTSLVNCTLDGNTSINGNGAIVTLVNAQPIQLTLTHNTITGNSAGVTNLVFAGSTGTVFLSGNVLAYNAGPNVYNGNGGVIVSDGLNVSDDGSFGLTDPTDQTNTDPLLGPLQDNGGPVWTRAPLPGSPAITNVQRESVSTDARGVARPQGGGYDAGAVESRYTLSITAGNYQSTQVGEDYAEALQVRLLEGDRPVGGVEVTFHGYGADLGGASSVTVVTNAQGYATVDVVTAGHYAGYAIVEAQVGGLWQTFYLYAEAGPVASYSVELYSDWGEGEGEGIASFSQEDEGESDWTPQVDPGEELTLILWARDRFGNVTTADGATITFTSSDPLAVLPGPVTFTESYYELVTGVRLYTGGLQTITVTDDAASPRTGEITLLVTNAPPGALEVVPSAGVIIVGEELTVSGRFEDPGDLGPHTVLITWGDGRQTSTVLTAGVTAFELRHVYTTAVAAPATITVTVTDVAGASAEASVAVMVIDLPPTVLVGDHEVLNVGDRFRRHGTITDPGGPGEGGFTVRVNYGDGTGVFNVPVDAGGRFTLDHVFRNEGSFLVTVTGLDGEGDMTRVTFYAHVLLPGVPIDGANVVVIGEDGGHGLLNAAGANGVFYRSPRPGISIVIVAPVPGGVAAGLDVQVVTVPAGSNSVVVGAAFDIRGINIGPLDYVEIVLEYYNDDNDAPTLSFFDPVLGRHVTIDPRHYRVDLEGRKIYLRLDVNSVPRLQDLRGTVFTITVPVTLAPTGPGFSMALLESRSVAPPGGVSAAQATTGGGLGEDGGALQLLTALTSTTTLTSSSEREAAPEPQAEARALGDGPLADLPPPPEPAVLLPGLSLTPAEPRSTDLGPPAPMPSDGKEEEQTSAPQEEAPASEMAGPKRGVMPLGLLAALAVLRRDPRRRPR